MSSSSIGVIGLAVMGANLARNFASRNIHTSVFNRTYEKTETLLKEHGNEYLHGFRELNEFISSLESPRRVLIMVQAGQAVDDVITQLIPLLQKDDIIIDGGNSDYHDTIRRTRTLEEKGLHFVGMGVSGGEEGALKGPSIMPGGTDHSWNALKPLLEKIAAKDFAGNSCVAHIGTDGAGHYVKMIHNGIEYAIMEIMAEIYDSLRKFNHLDAAEISEVFAKLHQGKLKSFLFEIAIPVLAQKDNMAEGFLVDKILDKAGQKGTGAWTTVDGALRGISIPTITQAVFARSTSAQKSLRQKLSQQYGKLKEQISTEIPSSKTPFTPELVSFLEQALYCAVMLCYAEGLFLISKTAKEQNWNIDLSEVCRIWQGGCIIRSELLKTLTDIYKKNPAIEHLLCAAEMQKIIEENISALRRIAADSVRLGLPMPSLVATVNSFDALTSEELPANFIQGLRDYFGAHTYERKDQPGIFHFTWFEDHQ